MTVPSQPAVPVSDVGRSGRLDRCLRDLLAQAPELEAAAVVSFDGLAMASALPAGMDEDRVAAMSAALLSLGEKAAQGLGRGDLSQVYIEGEYGTVFLVSALDEAVLVAVAAKAGKAGLMLYEVRRSAASVGAVLREDGPYFTPAPEPVTEEPIWDSIAAGGTATEAVETASVPEPSEPVRSEAEGSGDQDDQGPAEHTGSFEASGIDQAEPSAPHDQGPEPEATEPALVHDEPTGSEHPASDAFEPEPSPVQADEAPAGEHVETGPQHEPAEPAHDASERFDHEPEQPENALPTHQWSAPEPSSMVQPAGNAGSAEPDAGSAHPQSSAWEPYSYESAHVRDDETEAETTSPSEQWSPYAPQQPASAS
jgi:predicted regulator of Ras-like GTPase activity (Roadblock/LC7/MglB family)